MTQTREARPGPSNVSLYRAVWRWHFYAGLIILPVLLWLATTGALYLYKPELERALFPELVDVGQGIRAAPIADLIRSVERQTQGRVTQVTRPAAADESWRFAVRDGSGGERLAFVRPDTGRVLGTSRIGGPVELVKELHSLAIVGPVANVLVEIVAGWTIVLVLSGFYLWWPRAGGKALSLAGRIGERRFWRNFHASAGAVVGAIILFLAVTGMPWTTFWGGRFHDFVAARQIGRPPAPAGGGGAHDAHLPWSLRGSAMPHGAGQGDVGPDAAVRAAAARGLAPPWVLDMPDAPAKPYRLAPLLERARDARILYVAQADGRILQEDRWADFGIGAKAFEWGIYTHQGQEYGEPNRLVMLAGCIGVWLLAVSGPVLWWKRRRGGLSAPPRPLDRGKARGVAAIMLAIGALFPLTGLTMVAALLGDLAIGGWRRPRLPAPRSAG
jgi:uncharacterized iron-regulated membrane protein